VLAIERVGQGTQCEPSTIALLVSVAAQDVL
jgi:hypothetical protein